MAEAEVKRRCQNGQDALSEDIDKLVHELQTHQLELEMQNEELRRAQEELIESRDKYSDLYDFAPVGYVTLSEKDLICEANSTLADLLGRERQSLLKGRFSAFVVEEDQDEYYRYRRTLLETRERQTCDVQIDSGVANRLWIRLDGAAVEPTDSNEVQLRLAVADVTHRKRIEKEREDLVGILESQNAELERFTYTVSHDLKSPLITIQGYLGMLRQDLSTGDSELIEHDLGHISDAADKMYQLLGNLLELSRVGRLVSPPEVVSLEDLAREAVAIVAGQAKEKEVQVVISPGLPVVNVDRLRLREVLQNLIDNAVKYMGDQPQPRVEIGSRREGSQTICYVCDNGIGIEPQYHTRVFGLFDQLDQSVEGSGIGLALVQRIIEVHGGRVWIESKGRGHGSTVCFTVLAKGEST